MRTSYRGTPLLAPRLQFNPAMTDPAPTVANKTAEGYLWPRWLFLRALGLIFFSAFYALAFQIRGLMGERGIPPAGLYLDRVSTAFGPLARLWFAPTLLWVGSNDRALTAGGAAR